MIRVEDFLRLVEIALNAFFLAPRHGQHPINIIAGDIRFGAHRAHLFEFFDFSRDLLQSLFGELGFFNLLLKLGHFIRRIAIAQFGLDGFHLFIQIIFALGFFHLALHAAADLLFDFQHAGFGIDEVQNRLQTGRHFRLSKQLLLMLDLGIEMYRNNVRKLGRIFCLCNRPHNFFSNFGVELSVEIKLLAHFFGQGLCLARAFHIRFDNFGISFEVIFAIRERVHRSPLLAFDQNAYCPVRQL
ncbi:hypothetical protein LIHA111178_13580 [Litorimonas haliclonae]